MEETKSANPMLYLNFSFENDVTLDRYKTVDDRL